MAYYRDEETMETVKREWNEREAELDERIEEAERELAEINEGRGRRLAETRARVANKEEILRVLLEKIRLKRQGREIAARAPSTTTAETTVTNGARKKIRGRRKRRGTATTLRAKATVETSNRAIVGDSDGEDSPENARQSRRKKEKRGAAYKEKLRERTVIQIVSSESEEANDDAREISIAQRLQRDLAIRRTTALKRKTLNC